MRKAHGLLRDKWSRQKAQGGRSLADEMNRNEAHVAKQNEQSQATRSEVREVIGTRFCKVFERTEWTLAFNWKSPWRVLNKK